MALPLFARKGYLGDAAPGKRLADWGVPVGLLRLVMPEPVIIRDYDPAWPQRYEALRGPVVDVLGDIAAQIDHVGSTSVPGLAAKPTVDIVVKLRFPDDLTAAIERLARIGYAHEGDLGIAGREAFATPPGYGPHDHHLYVCTPDWRGYADQVVFRDYLRAHPDVASAYAALKRALADQHRDNRGAYTDGKADFVRTVLDRARGPHVAPPRAPT
jgi:GrpB-like predicted nucleotidyltransferase (UPF0157 family)